MFHENKQDIISSQNEQPEISNEPETTENPPEALYSQDDAQQLIEKGEVWRLAKELKNYQDLNENIAEQLLDKGYCREVLDNLDKFRDLEHSKILKCLIDDGHFEELIDYMDKLSDIPHQQIAQELINQGKIELLAQKLEKFSGLDENIAEQLIKENYYDQVLDNLRAFSNLSLDFAQKLIKGGGEVKVIDNLESFSPEAHNDIANDIAHLILKRGNGWYGVLLSNWKKFSKVNFSDEDYETIINHILPHDMEELAQNIDKFPRSFHRKIAQKLIDNKCGRELVLNLEKFSGLNHREIVQQLIDNEQGDLVAWYLQKFSNIDHNKIAQQLIDQKYKYKEYEDSRCNKYISSLVQNLEKFSGLDENIARQLIKENYYGSVRDHLKAFSNLSLDFAQELIMREKDNDEKILNNLESFSPEAHNDIVHFILKEGGQWYLKLLPNWEKLSRVDFSEEDYETIVNQIAVKYSSGWKIAQNIDKFPRSLHKKISQKLIDNNDGGAVAYNVEKFSQLSKGAARRLAELGYIEILAKYPEKFPELDSDLQKQVDNYKATHPNK